MKSLVVSLLVTASLVGQDTVVVPAYATADEGGSILGIVGINQHGRMQFVFDELHTAPLIGRRITAIDLRRDSADASAFVGGRTHFQIGMGPALVKPGDASESFEGNAAALVRVFDGDVDVPSSPPASGFRGWTSDHSFRITFQQPYDHLGGGLVLDLVGVPANGTWDWPVDAVSDPASGSENRIGTACGPTANLLGSISHVSRRKLVPGDTAIATCWGEAGSVAQLVLGFDLLPEPLDLELLGLSGCELHVSPVATLASRFDVTELGSAAPARAFLPLRIPNTNDLLGARLTLQWFQFGRTFGASEALDCRIASQPRVLGIAMVWGRPGSQTGIVYLDRAPVIRFHVE